MRGNITYHEIMRCMELSFVVVLDRSNERRARGARDGGKVLAGRINPMREKDGRRKKKNSPKYFRFAGNEFCTFFLPPEIGTSLRPHHKRAAPHIICIDINKQYSTINIFYPIKDQSSTRISAIHLLWEQ